MTNFNLFQTERVCRWQFQIWWKWQKVLQMGREHCGKKRPCSLRAISPFLTVFSKDLYCRHVKTRACLGKVKSLPHNDNFWRAPQKSLWKHLGKGENVGNQHFLLFPLCFLPFQRKIEPIKPFWNCRLQMFSIWIRLKFCRPVKGYL